MYGQPIQLRYMGDDTFKTLPGGILSILINFALICYSVLKFTDMLQRADWQITQQTVVSPIESLIKDHQFADLPNITMALQITPKRKKVIDEAAAALVLADRDGRRLEEEDMSYDQLVTQASKYITVQGMYELKRGVEYSPLDTSLNVDQHTWKNYETKVQKNNFQEQEIEIPLYDSVLAGSGDSATYMDQKLARIQIRLNETKLKIDSYRSCKKDQYLEQLKGRYCVSFKPSATIGIITYTYPDCFENV